MGYDETLTGTWSRAALQGVGSLAFNASSSEWSANPTTQTELLARNSAGRSAGSVGVPGASDRYTLREKAENDSSFAATVALETIQRAYERFQTTYAETMAFYDAAGGRIDTVERRLQEQIDDIERRTEQLEGPNGEVFYPDGQGGFYTLRDGERVTISDPATVEALSAQARAIAASGKTVRTESEDAHLISLTQTLTEAEDLKGEVDQARSRAEGWNARVEEDRSLAREADKAISADRATIEKRLEALEQNVNGLEFRGESLDPRNAADHTPEEAPISEWRATAPPEHGGPPLAGI